MATMHGTTTRPMVEEVEIATPPADPAPLGLAAFGITTLVLSVFNTHILNPAGVPVVLGLALAYGGLAQLLAGMWEFRNNNTFGATAFTSYGAFWISFWALNHWDAANIKGDVGNALGLYLVAWGIFTLYMFVASLRVSIAVATVLILLAATYFLLGIGNWAAETSVVKAGGYVGLATAAAALYTSFALVTNSTFGARLLPVFPLNRPLGKRQFAG